MTGYDALLNTLKLVDEGVHPNEAADRSIREMNEAKQEEADRAEAA